MNPQCTGIHIYLHSAPYMLTTIAVYGTKVLLGNLVWSIATDPNMVCFIVKYTQWYLEQVIAKPATQKGSGSNWKMTDCCHRFVHT